jgi:hypothetical protein
LWIGLSWLGLIWIKERWKRIHKVELILGLCGGFVDERYYSFRSGPQTRYIYA